MQTNLMEVSIKLQVKKNSINNWWTSKEKPRQPSWMLRRLKKLCCSIYIQMNIDLKQCKDIVNNNDTVKGQ